MIPRIEFLFLLTSLLGLSLFSSDGDYSCYLAFVSDVEGLRWLAKDTSAYGRYFSTSTTHSFMTSTPYLESITGSQSAL